MSSIPTIFQGDMLTKTLTLVPASNPDVRVTTLLTKATKIPAIATTAFLQASDTNFYQSDAYRQVVTDKAPPAISSYAKDPTGASDDSYDVQLAYTQFPTLGPGQTQMVLYGDRSVMVAGNNTYLTVQGDFRIGYGGLRVETMQGKLNQKVYNGEKSIYNGQSIRFYDSLVTTYEHQAVDVSSMANDTVMHFGERTIIRKGSEVQTVHGQTSSIVFGSETVTQYGNATEVILGSRNISMDHTINVKSVTGLRSEVSVGLAATATLGIAVALNVFAVVIAVREDLIGAIKGEVIGVKLDAYVTQMENWGVVGKALGICLRGTAGVLGILRA